ncbi:MAG: SDR family NAD(P)-dependent oxidoreductase [Chloroflexota bacterium]|nr:SDR family NAD(P)-dependent oxidoreductase [Chloroflexota bacterium]MDE2945596.1 SDR family NAD(P)-dependent oxidoreductase [Chloroflexota bacterium]
MKGSPASFHELRGSVAVVTGAAQGLGYAISKAYAAEGMRVAMMDIRGDILRRAANDFRAMGGDALPISVDLSDAAASQTAIDTVLEQYGTPRVLIHNAALLITRSMLEITLAQWQKEINIILQAAFILSKAVWKPMIDAGGGSIVYLSSGSGYKGFIEEVAYNPGKHGVEGLMKCLALEGKEFNIAVNAATPGAPINTPMSASNYTEAQKKTWVDPALLAPAFVMLARQDASGLTGRRVAARADGSWDAVDLL